MVKSLLAELVEVLLGSFVGVVSRFESGPAEVAYLVGEGSRHPELGSKLLPGLLPAGHLEHTAAEERLDIHSKGYPIGIASLLDFGIIVREINPD